MAYRAVGPEVPQPIGRHGTPRELANVALVVASDEASFVTGSVIVADGGMPAK
jgi:NAD(P)-dependent dehydrogenase (short-subunit alcohol dehydrogenase family)